MRPNLRKLAQDCLCLVAAGLIVEGLAAAFFTAKRSTFEFQDPRRFVIDDATVKNLIRSKAFDRDLGWTARYDSPYGERPRARAFDRPYLATYGDSFTLCQGVADDETWQTYVAQALGADVLNFGVGGYGTDQAYLRFKKNRPPAGTKYVSLGFILENINRTASVYRKFYFSATGIPLTKPMFAWDAGRLTLVPNPIQAEADLEKLTDPAFIETIGARDIWFSRDPSVRYGFPYARLIFDERIWRQAFDRYAKPPSDLDAKPSVNLWYEPRQAQRFLAILDRFAEEVREAGRQPLFVISPTMGDLARMSEGKSNQGLRVVLEHCHAKGYQCFDGISAFLRDDAGYLRSEALAPFFQSKLGGHLSAAGNRRFAERLANFLAKRRGVAMGINGGGAYQ